MAVILETIFAFFLNEMVWISNMISLRFVLNSLKLSDANMLIYVGKLTIIDSDNGLSPGRRLAIIWTNAGILLIGPLVTNFSENLFGTQTFSIKKMHLKMSSAKWRPFYLGLNVLWVELTMCMHWLR